MPARPDTERFYPENRLDPVRAPAAAPQNKKSLSSDHAVKR